ncbi:hypothetical protein [uncultured Chryseobacterium sp.]|uniref:hypothetical protein n=1 Tax=uncultured Chryseobacterium sp. TaxID=259322 RepID=UPI0026108DA3|nr:hypothetical protein [uncultured Chryseobacterium sp.]
MKSLKINLEDNTNFEKLTELLIQIKRIKSVEIIDDAQSESDLKKAYAKSKEQLKNVEYETLVNDIFDTFLKKKP